MSEFVEPTAHCSVQCNAPCAPCVEARDLSVTFRGKVAALQGVDLIVRPKEHVAIVGPSGSGKTTLLRCIAGALEPQCGRVSCQGRIASIHQDLRLVESKNALQNVLHGAMGRLPLWRSMLRFPLNERIRAMRLLQRVGLGHRVFTRVSSLSGGERQRVAIARALMQDPRVLLADEPVSNLDEVNRQAIMKLLSTLAAERGMALVTVLHDEPLAAAYADRILRLENGKVVTAVANNALRSPRTVQLVSPIDSTLQQLPPISDYGSASKLWTYALILSAVGALYLYSFFALGIDEVSGSQALHGTMLFLQSLFPTTFGEITALPWEALAWGLLETLQMALLGTTAGIIIAWPLAALAAHNTGPRLVRGIVRGILNVIRTVPSLIWALLCVAAVGIGSFAGVLALTAYSIGYLSKFFYEAFESVESGAPNALREMGASSLQSFLHAVWPAARPAVLSSSFFMFEYNVRAASVLGVVGAGGIGFYIREYIEFRYFPAVTASLLLILVVVLGLEWVSLQLKRRWLIRAH